MFYYKNFIFITLNENIYCINSKRVNILYTVIQRSNWQVMLVCVYIMMDDYME